MGRKIRYKLTPLYWFNLKFVEFSSKIYQKLAVEMKMKSTMIHKDEGRKYKAILKTYSESKSLSLYIQKLVETMPSSSLDPSRPTKTKKEPIPWRTLLKSDWISR